MKPVSMVLFHGTSADFHAFSDRSIGRGTETEPNNRLGVYLTPCSTEALDYAMGACSWDASVAKVLAVHFKGTIGPSFFSPSEQFVNGDLHDSLEGHAISDAFQKAHAAATKERVTDDSESDDEVEFDRCEVFSNLRESMKQSFDALWIESGENPYLVVLNPSALTIIHRLDEDAANRLGDAIAESELNINPFGQENQSEKSMEILNDLFGTSRKKLSL